MSRHRPYVVKMELTRGCSRRCAFCSLPNMAWVDEPWQFMPDAIFHKVVTELAAEYPQGMRLEFDGRGEPGFHPRIKELFRFAREAYPNCQMAMTTNGDPLVKNGQGWLPSLLEAGLNIVLLDCYTKERLEEARRFYPEAKSFFEDHIHPYSYHGPQTKQIILLDEGHGRENVVRRYHNQGGTVDPVRARKAGYNIPMATRPMQKMCVRPFRELYVLSDGTVPLCCCDWLPATTLGKIPENTLAECWERLDPYRRLLLTKDRSKVKPCDVCSSPAGFRVGLEMKWFGEAPKQKQTRLMELLR